jgi:mono/diheme cytochrome c family protein
MNFPFQRLSLPAIAAACLLTPAGLLMVTGARADDSAFTSMGGLGKASGVEIYSHICQGCHMPGGQGAVGAGHYPKLAGDPALVAWEYVAITVLNGKHGMPAFGLPQNRVMETRSVHLSDAQVADVVNYVRNNFGNNYQSKVTAQQVAKMPHPGGGGPTED